VKRIVTPLALPLLLLALAPAARAEDKAAIDRTQIIGNRELPKVIYIVPWKKPLPGDLGSRPLDSVIDEALAPVDRDVFRRQVRYDGILQSRVAEAAASANQPSANTAAPSAK
jgi:hypothetical protein